MAATIEGAFVLIDRASSTMEKMERQAKKTMAAIEGVGVAADAQSRRAQTAQRAVEGHSGALKDTEQEASKTERALKGMGNEFQRSEARVKQLERALSSMRSELQRLEQQQRRTGQGGSGGGLGGIKGFKKDLDDVGKAIGAFLGSFGVLGNAMSMFKLPAMGAGIGVLVQGIGALAGAVIGFLPDLAALASGLMALPAVFGVAAQGVGSFMAAMQGVMGAVQAGMQAQNQWGQNQREWSQQVVQAQRAVADAVHGVSDAQFAQGQAVYALNDAYYQHQQSLHSLNEAIYSQTQAQINLTVARRDAMRTLQDMEFQAKSAVLQEARAGLNIRQAQQELQQAMMTPGTSQMTLESDRLAVMEAQSAAAQTHTQAVRSRVDYQRAARGDPTSAPVMQVAQAQHALANATYGVGQAQHEVAVSNRQIAVAQHQLADSAWAVAKAEQGVQQAQFQLNTLYRQGNSGVSAYRKQLMALQPIQRQFVQFLVGRMGPGDKNSLIGQIQQLQQAAGEGLFPQLERAVRTLMPAFPMLDGAMRTSGRHMGELANNVVQAFFGPKGIGATKQILSGNNDVLKIAADAAGHLAGILRSLMVAAQPLLKWAAQMIDHWLKLHDAFFAGAKGQDELHKKFDRFKTVLTGLLDVLKNLWTIFTNVSRAAQPLTDFLNKSVVSGTGNLAALTGSKAGQTSMRNWFTGLIPVLRALGSFAKDVGRGLAVLTSPGANRVGAGLIRSLGGLVPIIAQIILSLEKAFGPPVVAALSAFGRALGGATGNASPLATWLRLMTQIVKLMAWLLNLPVVGRGLVTFLAALFAVRTVSNYASKLLDVVKHVTSIRDRWRQAGDAQKNATKGMPSPGTTGGRRRGGGFVSRVWNTITGGGGVQAEQASAMWGVRSMGGPGSEANPLIVRVQGGGIGSGSAGNPFQGGSSTLSKAGTVDQAAEDATKLSRVEGVGAWLAGKGAIGRGIARFGGKIPGLGGLARGAASGAGEVGAIAEAASPVLGVLSKAAPLLLAIPAALSFLTTKGSVGTRAGAAASTAVSMATFGIVNPNWNWGAPSAAAQRAKGNVYANRDFAAAAALGTSPLGTLSQAGLNRMYSTKGSLQKQIYDIQHPTTINPMTGQTIAGGTVDKAKLEARRAELAAVNAAIIRDQQQAGLNAAGSWGDAFAQGVDQGEKPKTAMKRLIGGLGMQLADLKPAGQKTLLQSMAAWGGSIEASDPQMKGPIDRLNSWIEQRFASMGQNVQIVNGAILTGSQTEWQGIAKALTDPMEVAKEKLDGTFAGIQAKAVGELQLMGLDKNTAQMLVKNPQSAANWMQWYQTGNTGGSNAPSKGVGPTGALGHRAGGGRVPGSNPRDVYAYGGAMLGGGELVMNKWHEADANARLMRHGEPTVGAIVAGRNTPNWLGRAAGGYVDPIPGFTLGRTDMGVDANAPAGTPIVAMGDSTLAGVQQNWYHGQPLLDFQLTSGPDAGRYWYVAEQITPVTEKVGSTFKAGQVVARYAPSGTGIEIGWAANASGTTLAQATSGYSEGQQTTAGKQFASFITGLSKGQLVAGGPGGGFGQIDGRKLLPKITGLGGVPLALAGQGANTYAMALAGALNAGLSSGAPGTGTPVNVPGNLTGWLSAAMQATGVSGPLWMRMLQRQAMRESSGNPASVNNWDVNAKAGNPSEGLLQTTLSTFQSYMLPGHGNILNPVDNSIAAIRYMIARYGGGDASRAAQVMWDRGGGAYATGGRLNWGGWHQGGGTFTTNGPTLFGAGEGGRPETVSISSNSTGGRPVNITIHKIEVHRKGDIKKVVDEELALLADSLRGG